MGVGRKLSYFHKTIGSWLEVSPFPSPFSLLLLRHSSAKYLLDLVCVRNKSPHRREPTLLRKPGEGEIKAGLLSSKIDWEDFLHLTADTFTRTMPQTRPQSSPRAQPETVRSYLSRYFLLNHLQFA